MDPLYKRVLGPAAWAALPEPVRQLHDLRDRAVFTGRARVVNGEPWLARLLRKLMRLPPAGDDVPLRVTLERQGDSERWTRQFGAHRFHSVLSPSPVPGCVIERFGPLWFRLRLPADERGLSMPLERAYALGLPLPGFLTPRSDTHESVDTQGRFRFSVDVSLLGIGRIVRYEGWLRPVESAAL